MTLNLRPLLSALRRSPTGAVLVTLQVAITLAVLVNAAWVVTQRVGKLEQPTGLEIPDTFGLIVGSVADGFDIPQAESEDLAYLRGLPAVASATVTIGIPLTGMGAWDTGLRRQPGQRGAAVPTDVMLENDPGLMKTLDVPLIAGRDFRPDEIQPLSSGKATPPLSEIILTAALAHALFPHGSALGRTVYDQAGNPLTVIGITRNFMGAIGDASSHPVYHVAVLPAAPGQSGFYALLVRTRPGKRDAVMRAAEQHIGAAHRDGVIANSMTLTDAKQAFESENRNVAIFLTFVTALMLAVCCLGIFGLTTFNVGSRTRQIGTRRAVGASRRDIMAHFMVENAIILTAGAALGSVLALAIGAWLTARYALPRLDLTYLLGGVAALSVIGQLAAWQPARRAASVPPSVATRTV